MLRRNIIANYLYTIIQAAINIFSLSLLIKFYGLENWGGIAKLLVIMNTLMLFDLGLSQVYINKYNRSENKDLVFSKYFNIILYIGASISVSYYLFSLIFNKLENLNSNFLLSLLIFTVFINNMFYIHLNASQNHVALNARLLIFLILKISFAIIFANIFSPSVSMYLLVYLIISLLELIYNIKNHEIKIKIKSPGKLEIIEVFHEMKLTTLVMIFGVILINIDRLVLSQKMDAEYFGIYAAIVTIGLYSIQFQYPITKAIFPYLTTNLNNEIFDINLIIKHLVAMLIMTVPLFILAFVFENEIIKYFVRKNPTSNMQFLFESVLIFGITNTIYNVIYIRVVASEEIFKILIINVISLILSILCLTMISNQEYFEIGSISWISISMVQIIGTIFLFKDINKKVKNVK